MPMHSRVDEPANVADRMRMIHTGDEAETGEIALLTVCNISKYLTGCSPSPIRQPNLHARRRSGHIDLELGHDCRPIRSAGRRRERSRWL